MIFLSHFKHPVLVMKTMKTDKEGDIKQEPIYITFEDNVYETDEQSIIDFLKSRKNFGAEYWQVDKVPSNKGYQGHANVVAKMDSPNQALEAKNAEVLELNSKVDKLTNLVSQLLKKQAESAVSYPEKNDSPSGEGTPFLDRRTKEYKESQKV